MPPSRPSALPRSLDAEFRVADALESGLTRRRLESSDLDRQVWGVRGSIHESSSFLARCRLFSRRLGPDVFFSGSTAARLSGAPLPSRLDLSSLDVSVRAPLRAPHAHGIVGHSRILVEGDVEARDGLRLSSAPRMIAELAPRLGLGDLVAVIDWVIAGDEPRTTTLAIRQRMAAGDPLMRSRRLREALVLADPRAESPAESRLRVALVTAGLRGWVPNHPVVDPQTARRFRIDLALVEQRLALEYHGDYHRDVVQWRRDITRRSILESMGWRVVEITAADLARPGELAARIRRFLP